MDQVGVLTAERYLSLSLHGARSEEVPVQSPSVHIHESLFSVFLN